MIFRILESEQAQPAILHDGEKLASSVFVATEKAVRPPCVIILQLDHSRLAGDLARALSPEPFGEFPPEVVHAAAEHDLGWIESDAAQMQQLGTSSPEPFPCLSVDQIVPAFRSCIDHARSLPRLTDALISRHFTALASKGDGYQPFLEAELRRQEALEAEIPYSKVDLERWTDIVGFCDSLSLYLCSGLQHEVDFPLAHPATEKAASAPRITLSWRDGPPHFATPLLKSGAALTLSGSIYDGTSARTTPIDYTWTFA
jgi:hypothetical protein